MSWSFQALPLWLFRLHRVADCPFFPLTEPLAALLAQINTTAITDIEAVYNVDQQGDCFLIWGAYAKRPLLNYAAKLMDVVINQAIREYGSKRFENSILQKIDRLLTSEDARSELDRLVESTHARCEQSYGSRWESRYEFPGVAEWRTAVIGAALMRPDASPLIISDIVNLAAQVFRLKDIGRDEANSGLKEVLNRLRKNCEVDEAKRRNDGRLLMAYYGTGPSKPWGR